MTILKNSVKSRIISSLGGQNFCREDFTVVFPDNGNTLVNVTFSAKPEYTFRIYESSGVINFANISRNADVTPRTICQMSPGQYKNVEQKSYDDLDSVIATISHWLGYIKEDLINLKFNDTSTIDEFTQNFQRKIDETIDEPDSYFTEAEANVLKEKLDELKRRIEELEARDEISNNDKKQFDSAINKTKSDLDIYPKGIWYKIAGNKIISLIKAVLKTQEGRQALFEVAKKLLGA